MLKTRGREGKSDYGYLLLNMVFGASCAVFTCLLESLLICQISSKMLDIF